jgi:PAS domain S-box-containing protein
MPSLMPDNAFGPHLEEALRMAQLGFWEFDPSLGEFLFNEALYETILHTHVAAEGGMRMPFERLMQRFIHLEDHGIVQEGFAEAQSHPDPGHVTDFRCRLHFKDGQEAQVQCLVRRKQDGSGFFGIVQDVTEQRWLADQLEAQKGKRAEAMWLARLGTWDYDPACRMFSLDDDFFTHILGSPPESSGGYLLSADEAFSRFLVPEDRPLLESALKRAMESQDAAYQGVVECRVQRPSGMVADIRFLIHLLADAQGRTNRLFGTAQDVTEQRSVERDRDARNAFLRSMLDNLPFMAWMKDTQGRYLSANRHFVRAVGYSNEEEVLLRTDRELWPLAQAEAALADDRAVMAMGRQRMVEERLDEAAGERWVETFKSPVFGPGNKLLGTTGFSKDITARKQAEKALHDFNHTLERRVEQRTVEISRLLEQREDLIRHLGHDLKTPLTPLMALLPLLVQGEQDPERKRMLAILQHSTRNIQRVVVNTLDLARISSPSTALSAERLELHDAVDKAIHETGLEFGTTDSLSNQVALGMAAQADRRFIHKVLVNLFSNALRYSMGGEVKIEALARGPMVEVKVSDKGQGLTPEQLDRIFDEYYKADTARHELTATGLGLSICRRVVERHNGRIWAESPGPGLGSVFCFTLPLAA